MVLFPHHPQIYTDTSPSCSSLSTQSGWHHWVGGLTQSKQATTTVHTKLLVTRTFLPTIWTQSNPIHPKYMKTTNMSLKPRGGDQFSLKPYFEFCACVCLCGHAHECRARTRSGLVPSQKSRMPEFFSVLEKISSPVESQRWCLRWSHCLLTAWKQRLSRGVELEVSTRFL